MRTKLIPKASIGASTFVGITLTFIVTTSLAMASQINLPLLRSRPLPLLQKYAVNTKVSNGNNKLHLSTVTTWYTETIDSGEDLGAGRYSSLTLDKAGYPHISYYDNVYSGLKYAQYDGTTWHIETVDSGGGLYGTSLALDALGHPRISYRSSGGDLKYAWNDGATWHIETIDASRRSNHFVSLALDAAGHPHISYYSTTYFDGDLKYAWYNGSAWQIETIDSGDNNNNELTGIHSSLALDKNGRPHISYWDFTNGDVKYAQYNGNDWQIEIIDDLPNGGWYNWTSLDLDNAGHPHVSYYDATNQMPKYARYDGISWRIENIGNEKRTGEATSLVLDENGQPHLSYYDADNKQLSYFWQNNNIWHIETVDSTYWSWENPLTLDENGHPHISYYDGTGETGKLKYAEKVQLFLGEQIVPSEKIHNSDILTITLTFSTTAPVSKAYLWSPLPDNIQYIANSLTGTITPLAIYSSALRVIVWQGNLPNNTAATIQFRVTPSITGSGSLLLAKPIVATAWLTDTRRGNGLSVRIVANGYKTYIPLIVH